MSIRGHSHDTTDKVREGTRFNRTLLLDEGGANRNFGCPVALKVDEFVLVVLFMA